MSDKKTTTNTNVIMSLSLLLTIIIKLILKLTNLILSSDIPNTPYFSSKAITLISYVSTQIDSYYILPIIFWILLLVLIPYSIYKKEAKRYFVPYILTFINVVIYNGFSKTFFNTCISYITLNYKTLAIILATICGLVLVSLFIRKTISANIYIKQKAQENHHNAAESVARDSDNSLEHHENDNASANNPDVSTIDEESFEKHPYLSTFNELRNQTLKNIISGSSKERESSPLLSIVFFVTIVLLIFFVIVCIKNQQSISEVLEKLFSNLENIFNLTNYNTGSLEGSITNFLLSLGVLLLIPIVFLIVVLIFVFSIGILIYSISRTTILKKYINKIVDRIEYFFFETILNTINPFILIPDFVSTIIYTVFGIDVEDYVNNKINNCVKGENNESK